MESILVKICDLIISDPSRGFLLLSVVANIWMAKQLINYNNKYIQLLIDNADVAKQVNLLFQKFRIKKELPEHEEAKEE